MSGPPVIITGASGLVGTRLRRALAARHRLLSVDRLEVPPLPVAADEETFKVDLGSPEALDRFWEGLGAVREELAGIVHLAWFYDFNNVPDPRYEALLTTLSHWLDRIAREAPADMPFLFASSMAALAPCRPGERLTEQSPRLGAWAYPASKIAAERILEEHRMPQPRGELVLAGVYTDACELVPLFQSIERIVQRTPEKYLLPASPDRGLTYVHVEEAAEAFARALQVLRGTRGVERFLIGQEDPVTYRTIHRRAAEALLGHEIPLVRVPSVVAKAGAGMLQRVAQVRGRRRFIQPWMIPFAGEHFEFDLRHTKSVLGWSPWRSLERDLDGILQLARTDRRRWLALNQARPW